MPGHPIIGYITKSPGITVHRAECAHFGVTKRDPERIVEAYWDGELGGVAREVGMRVTIGQRPNVLADITNAIRPMNISIIRAEYRPGDNGDTYFDFVFETNEEEGAKRVAATLRTVAGVASIKQVAPAKLFKTKS